MYQIKFLKTPTISLTTPIKTKSKPASTTQSKNTSYNSAYNLSTTLTITNDLGERWFYGHTTLLLEIRLHMNNEVMKVNSKSSYKIIKTAECEWDAGLMAVNVSCPLKTSELPLGKGYITVFVKVKDLTGVIDELNYEDENISNQVFVKETVREKLSYFNIAKDHDKLTSYENKFTDLVFLNTISDFMKIPAKISEFPMRCDRKALRLINDPQISSEYVILYEELSGTIARHLWDAGIFLNLLPISTILDYTGFKASDKLDILELGTGIGLGGIRLAQVFPKAKILVTDLDDAKVICEDNIKLNDTNKADRVRFRELDWESPVKTLYQSWDLILVTDCIYNPLYYDWLINVMKVEALAKTKVLFLHKFREPVSECEFFPKVREWFELEKQWWWRLNDGILVHVGLYSKKT
ncbi:hypothetical protein WICPIJ_000867 [Wickerhamomyces pijperi]|uniref:Uncharacterized protein n=1 Tax=Wickerhamomyces pijperi TaxID=599730 RepID=A0A9P8QF73_WICPI|nr:hypothetical protein WICPIJ_000867 [Wickerhamomyces pijperi]